MWQNRSNPTWALKHFMLQCCKNVDTVEMLKEGAVRKMLPDTARSAFDVVAVSLHAQADT
ncbi:uncharacterized protein [Physcomitrium patens]|uniref:uncharacterized protein n=1 Tax=Physcomitrium patens TaxID=3218 RepID=UPI003CCD1EB3